MTVNYIMSKIIKAIVDQRLSSSLVSFSFVISNWSRATETMPDVRGKHKSREAAQWAGPSFRGVINRTSYKIAFHV